MDRFFGNHYKVIDGSADNRSMGMFRYKVGGEKLTA